MAERNYFNNWAGSNCLFLEDLQHNILKDAEILTSSREANKVICPYAVAIEREVPTISSRGRCYRGLVS